MDGAQLINSIRKYRATMLAQGMAIGTDGSQVPLWPMSLSSANGEALRDIVIREDARRTIEVGLGVGISCGYIIEGVLHPRENQAVGPDRFHTEVDACNDWWHNAGIQTLRSSEAHKVTRLLHQPSETALPVILNEVTQGGARFDFAFVDGSHLFDHVLVDAFYLIRLVKPGGLILFDDHYLKPIQLLLAFAVKNWAATLVLYESGGAAGRFVGLRCGETPYQRRWDEHSDFGIEDLPAYDWDRRDPSQ